MFNFRMEEPISLSGFFFFLLFYFFIFIFLLTPACRATTLRCVSHINYWPLLQGEQTRVISEQRWEGERLYMLKRLLEMMEME